jgi:hypothetical protein
MITLLNGEHWNENDIIKKMYDDEFYYGHLGKHALSSSYLKPMLKSPKAYLQSKNEDSDKQQFRDGRLIHFNILEKQKLSDLVIIEGTKAKKEFKEATQQYGSSMVYTQSEFNNAKFIAKAIENCKEAMELLEGADFEVPGIEMIEGVPVRAKADALKGDLIIDLKTTSDIFKWKWSAKNFDYNLQAALYCKIFGVSNFTFLVLDKTTLDVGIYEASLPFLEDGWSKVESALRNYKYWFEENPDPYDAINNYVIRDII